MSINNVVAFQGWNSSNRAWNTSTWNGDVAYSVTATGSVGSATSAVSIDVSVTGVAGTSALGNIFSTNVGVSATGSVGSTTVVGLANVSVTGVSGTASVDSSAVGITGDVNSTVTGVAGTSALGNIFTTNVGFSSTASVNSATVSSSGEANISVTGVSATGQVGAGTGEVFPVWGQIIPSQTSNFSAISPSQTPSWENIAA
tara:strand:- start:1263 stop:1865 length:603 start_codon:yes stop_codon:yes gene_type:complete